MLVNYTPMHLKFALLAALLYVQAAQLNTVVPNKPYDFYGGTSTVNVTYQGKNAPPLDISEAAGNPGVFIVLNSDWTVNSMANPTKPGSTIVVYATGLDVSGVIFPDGQIVPAGTLLPYNFIENLDAVWFDHTNGTILWEGAAPDIVFGAPGLRRARLSAFPSRDRQRILPRFLPSVKIRARLNKSCPSASHC